MSYIEEVKDDICDYLTDNYTAEEYNDAVNEDIDDFIEKLEDELWAEDSVTGNGSGSYTFSREGAKENVLNDEFETIGDAIDEGYYTAEELGHAVVNADWETIDVISRCFVLRGAIHEVIDEHPEYDF